MLKIKAKTIKNPFVGAVYAKRLSSFPLFAVVDEHKIERKEIFLCAPITDELLLLAGFVETEITLEKIGVESRVFLLETANKNYFAVHRLGNVYAVQRLRKRGEKFVEIMSKQLLKHFHGLQALINALSEQEALTVSQYALEALNGER